MRLDARQEVSKAEGRWPGLRLELRNFQRESWIHVFEVAEAKKRMNHSFHLPLLRPDE